MIITHHREKLVNSIVYFAKHTNYCGKTKLMKLLFFLDFCHFKQTGKSVTGQEYFAWEHGPVPKTLHEEVSGDMQDDLSEAIKITSYEKFQQISPKKKFISKFFTKREKKLLKDIAFIFKEAKAEQIVEVSHLKNEPWHKTLKEKGPYQKIDYMLSVDDSADSLTYDEAVERMREIAEMHGVFGTA